MKIKTTKRYRLTPEGMAIIKKSTNNKGRKGMEKSEAFYTVGWNENWCNHYKNSSLKSWKKEKIKTNKQNQKNLKIELLYDSTIPFPGIYPEKTIIQKHTCTPMFISAQFTNYNKFYSSTTYNFQITGATW